MSPLQPEAWQALSPYLEEALNLREDEREAWLTSLAAHDKQLAQQVRMLLEEQEAADREHFLDRTAAEIPAQNPMVGRTVGPYTLASSIGEGGMGSVWLA